MSTDFRGRDPKGLPLVSIVAVSYNHERFLEETLDSIKAQTYPNIQLIIMDDCSQDNSVAKIEQWIEKNNVNCRFIAHKENQGLCKTLNEALEYCEGEYYQAIACDDVMLHEKISLQVDAFNNYEERVGLLYTDSIIINEKGKQISDSYWKGRIAYPVMPRGEVFKQLIQQNFINAPTVLIKREVFEKLGGYDESLLFEDWDFFLRVALSYKVEHINKTTIKYRKHDKSLYNSKFNDNVYLESILKSQMKLLKISRETDNYILNRLYSYSFKFYKEDYRTALYWNFKKLGYSWKLKTFLIVILIFFGIKHSQYIKFISIWKD